MASRLLRSAAAAAVLLPLWGAPAQAQTVPEGPVAIYLKDHEDLPLDADGTGVRLSADHDLWTLRSVELDLLGAYQVVHDESGQCLTADTSGGGETAPVLLADCAAAVAWTIEYDGRPSHEDFRFATPDGYRLGLEDNGVVEGSRILAVKIDAASTLHAQEWRFAAGDAPPTPPPTAPPTAPPSETPSAPDSSAPPAEAVAQPKLPQTGAGAGVAVGVGAAALLGGAALVVWWQRRRVLRSHW